MPERRPASNQDTSTRRNGENSLPTFVFGGTIDIASWQDYAACVSPIVEMITPDAEDIRPLIDSYCFFCPVKVACLDASFDHSNPDGIWGGTTYNDRRRMRRVPGLVEQLHESVLIRRATQEAQTQEHPVLLEEFSRVANDAKEKARIVFEQRKEHGVTHAEIDPWIGTLLREGMDLGRSVMFARLDVLAEKKEFAQTAGIDDDQLGLIERNMATPMPAELNLIIKASALEPMGIPAQMIRLLRENRPPMELDELQSCSFGELFRYIRQLKGDSPVDAARAAMVDPQTIRNIESSAWGMRKSTKRKILSYMDLDPRSAIAEIAYTKLDDPDANITSATLKRVSHGQYLFAPSIQGARVTNTTEEDQSLNELAAIQQELREYGASEAEVLGSLLCYEREKRGLSLTDVADAINMEVNNLINIESGNKGNIQAVTRARIGTGMGLRIHDAEMRFFIDLNKMAA